MHVETMLAFDPGGTTGYCIVREDTAGIADYGQLGAGPHHLALWSLLSKENPDVVIFEQFVYQRRELSHGVSLNLDAKEYIGILRLWCEINNVRCVAQSVGHVKAFSSDAKLSALGLNLTHKDRHAKDSIRHMIYYQVHVLKNRAIIQALRGNI